MQSTNLDARVSGFKVECFPFREPERSGVREHINMKIVCEQTVGRLKGEENKTQKKDYLHEVALNLN